LTRMLDLGQVNDKVLITFQPNKQRGHKNLILENQTVRKGVMRALRRPNCLSLNA
jgi:hypothetical protein